jgi:glucose-1-phosphate cytidylyltransferase
MKVIILCGGLGTRLREQTEFIPKPMVPIGTRPILWHIMKIYYHQGFNEFILPLGYKGELIKDYFVHYKWKSSDFTLEIEKDNKIEFHDSQGCENWKIHFVDTGLHTSTAKRVYLVKKLIENDPQFMLTYGDGVADINLKELMDFHKSKKAVATITGYRPQQRFGLVEEREGTVMRFKEKPQMSDLVNCGFMIFNREALKYFNDKDVMLETEVLPRIAKDGLLGVYTHQGSWHYMDTQRDYELLNKIWEEGPKWKIWND